MGIYTKVADPDGPKWVEIGTDGSGGGDLVGGVAGWAAIESVSGSADLATLKADNIAPDSAIADADCPGTYNITADGVVWRVAVFTSGSSGSVQSSGGIADLLVVGASSTGTGGYISPGAFAARGPKQIGTVNDVLVAETPPQGSDGTQGQGSNFGSIGVGGGGSGRGAHGNVSGNDVPAGPGYGQFGSLPSSITGELIHYCADGATQYGNVDGGVDKWNWPGQGTNYNGPTPHGPRGGIVIVRAPKDAEQPWEPAPEIPGVGGWATITAVTGDYTKYPYNDGVMDWVAYEWTGDGTLQTSGGLVDALVVGGGGPAMSTTGWGGGGYLVSGLRTVPTTADITIGQGGGKANWDTSDALTKGRETSLGNIKAGGGGHSFAGPTGDGTNSEPWNGFYSTIVDGSTSVLYAPNGKSTVAAPGRGSNNPSSRAGQPGVVIVRVPAANATATRENPHGWLNFATVENGVVTSVNKTPDNIPYTTAVDEVSCDPEVAEGWNYDGSEFIAPEPDYSEQIKELEETLNNLRSDM